MGKISLNWCPKTCANFGGKPECISFPSAAPTFIPSIDQNNSPVSSPSVVPSLKPSLQPISSTSSPTSSPPISISPTVDCTDNPNFAWQGDENKDCAFIANKNLDSQKINWCNREHKDPDTDEKTKISLNWCPKTCANFGGKPECISLPSAAPTSIPSLDPINSPVSAPTISISPTVDCTDKPNFAWRGNENKIISLNWCRKTCANFGGKPECASEPASESASESASEYASESASESTSESTS